MHPNVKLMLAIIEDSLLTSGHFYFSQQEDISIAFRHRR